MCNVNEKILEKAKQRIQENKDFQNYKNLCEEAKICYKCGADLVLSSWWNLCYKYDCLLCKKGRLKKRPTMC